MNLLVSKLMVSCAWKWEKLCGSETKTKVVFQFIIGCTLFLFGVFEHK